jgi:hypothetical protein
LLLSPSLDYIVIVVKYGIQSIAKGLISQIILTTLTGMARPRKDPAMRMDTDLRVPMTEQQKQMLDDATADEPEGKAAWARSILLDAAKRKLAKNRKDKPERG